MFTSGSGFKLPPTFDLEDPEAYYQRVVVPRRESDQRKVRAVLNLLAAVASPGCNRSPRARAR